MNMRNLWALVVLCACTTLAHAAIYKWKDADGNMHYSDTLPTVGQGKAQVVDIKSMPVSALPATRYQAQNSPRLEPAASVPAAAQPARKEDPVACKNAHERLAFLQNATKLQSINEKGEVEMLDADRKQMEIDKANEAIRRVCVQQ